MGEIPDHPAKVKTDRVEVDIPHDLRDQIRLKIYYTLYKAPTPVGDRLLILHHGICHTREHFQTLIAALNALGFHVAMIEQQSAGAKRKNRILMNQYRQGMGAAVNQILETHQKLNFIGYVCHSMGALICEEMQQLNFGPRKATVFMAPIPVRGAFPISWRLFRRRPDIFAIACLTLSVLSLVKKPKDTRFAFFDSRTDPATVQTASDNLTHAPFFAYVQLIFRNWRLLSWLGIHLPIIEDDNNPKLLLLSATDEIFYPNEYKETRGRYPKMSEEHIKGGHDFFVEYAQQTAEYIQSFFTIEIAKMDLKDLRESIKATDLDIDKISIKWSEIVADIERIQINLNDASKRLLLLLPSPNNQTVDREAANKQIDELLQVLKKHDGQKRWLDVAQHGPPAPHLHKPSDLGASQEEGAEGTSQP